MFEHYVDNLNACKITINSDNDLGDVILMLTKKFHHDFFFTVIFFF